MLASSIPSLACTNVIITKGASADGSCMVSYAADSHWLFGALKYQQSANHRPGDMRPIIEWDTFRPLGSIPEVPHTFQRTGNQNEHQLIIAETTWGGREEQMNSDGIMDYGSLIYVTLERARTAREAIETIVALANEYGYPSEGETFSIADTQEAWVMDLVGKGGQKGIVWVARRIPDGYICAHANQARITRFPWDDPQNCLYAPDVADFARSRGWYEGSDEDFSFRDAYNRLDFGAARGCDARAWAAFNILCDGKFTYMDGDGREVTRPSEQWLDYAMGYELDGEMPLFVKPGRKVSVKDVADVMRDHFEGTPMDMRSDIGAGGNACPYRWRPMGFSHDGKYYVNERAIATQQTGFWFVAQARGFLPDEVGALQWFGCDDAGTSYLTPIYACIREVPDCLKEGNGDLLHYSATSQFWINNRITNACYRMYDQMEPMVRAEVDRFENEMMGSIGEQDAVLVKALGHSKGLLGKIASRKVARRATKWCSDIAQKQFAAWVALEETLTVKFIDGNVKAQNEDGSFKASEYDGGTPDGLTQPGYTDVWKRAVATSPHGDVLRAR